MTADPNAGTSPNDLSPAHVAALRRLGDEAPAAPTPAAIRDRLQARSRRRRVRIVGLTVAAAAVIALVVGLGSVIETRAPSVDRSIIADGNANRSDDDRGNHSGDDASNDRATSNAPNATGNDRDHDDRDHDIRDPSPRPDDAPPPPDDDGDDRDHDNRDQPTLRATPIAADASLTAMQDGVSNWLRSIGANRALIRKLPRDGLSISVAGSTLSPNELSADLAVLFEHYDLVSVRLDGHGLRCSLSQLH